MQFCLFFIYLQIQIFIMKKLLILLFATLLSLCAMAQLEVKPGSFKEVEGFVNLNPDPDYQFDDNDLPYAIIKVRTENITDKQRRELLFEGNAGTFIMLEYKVGEVWVYLTAKYATYIKISHPDFSSYEFTLPEDLKPKQGYEITLVSKNANQNLVTGFGSLSIVTKPENGAYIQLNGSPISEKTPYNISLFPAGRYKITVNKDGFKETNKEIEVRKGEKAYVEIAMEPNNSESDMFLSNKTLNIQDKSIYSSSEGMWLPYSLNDKTLYEMQQLGCKITPEQIFSLNQPSIKDAIVQFGGGCTGVMISKDGLCLTNYHCGQSYIQKLSTTEHDYVADGYCAYNFEEELSNQGLRVSFLANVEDVTDEVVKGVRNDETREETVKANIQYIQKQRKSNRDIEIEIVEFYNGNQYILFEYNVYKDVRLVFCPPWSIGKFGAYTDNWMWPRYKGDFCLFRIYTDRNGNPSNYSNKNVSLNSNYYLPISLEGVEEDDFTMVLGYPGTTDRYATSYAIKNLVDYEAPGLVKCRMAKLNEYHKHMDNNSELFLKYSSKIGNISNYCTYYLGQQRQLADNHLYNQRKHQETEFIKWVNGSITRNAQYGNAIDIIHEKWEIIDDVMRSMTYIREAGWNGGEAIAFSRRFRKINSLINNKASKTEIEDYTNMLKPYVESFFKDYDKSLDYDVTIALLNLFYKEVDKYVPSMITEIGTKNKEDFTNWVTKAFQTSIFVDKNKMESWLKNPKRLDKDPIFALMSNLVDEYLNVIYPKYEKAISIGKKGERLYMKGLIEMQDDRNFYPDANFTMRLNYGYVKGYQSADNIFDYYTTGDGLVNRYIPDDKEFDLPQKLIELIHEKDFCRYADQDGDLHVSFITTNDITGGSSGSPVINSKGELVGLVFDQNWEAMTSDFCYDPTLQRTICLDIRYALFIIDKYAGAKNIIDELDIKQ